MQAREAKTAYRSMTPIEQYLTSRNANSFSTECDAHVDITRCRSLGAWSEGVRDRHQKQEREKVRKIGVAPNLTVFT